jgi:hypothetical protein
MVIGASVNFVCLVSECAAPQRPGACRETASGGRAVAASFLQMLPRVNEQASAPESRGR